MGTFLIKLLDEIVSNRIAGNEWVSGKALCGPKYWLIWGEAGERSVAFQAGGWMRHCDLPMKHSWWSGVLRAGRKSGGKDKETEKADTSWPLAPWHAARFRVLRNRWKKIHKMNWFSFSTTNVWFSPNEFNSRQRFVFLFIWLEYVCKGKKTSLRHMKRCQIVKD